MKITRTERYKEMLKLLSSAKSIQAHLERISGILDSRVMPTPDLAGASNPTSVISGLIPEMRENAAKLDTWSLRLKKAFEESKPSRFTESQLSEMRNLRKIGMPINKLSKYFNSSDITIKKHLAD